MGNVDFDAEANVVAIELFKFSMQVEAWQKQGRPARIRRSAEVVDAERARPRSGLGTEVGADINAPERI
jgi:hypothetical protein